MCVSVRYQTPFSSRHESGPSLFLSTGKHPVVGQLPRVFSLLCLGRAATVQTYHPTKNFRYFSFLSPVFGEQPPKHAVDKGSEESIVQRPNGQVRSFRGRPSRPSFSTGPWSSCIVTGHDRLMTVTSQRTMPAPAGMRVDLLPVLAVDLLVQQATARVRFAGSVSYSCFTSIAIDRARRSSPVVRAICQRSIGSVSTASKRRHMAWCCVCMQVNETGHAQRLNMLKQRPRKWFFREVVDFLSSLAFVVN